MATSTTMFVSVKANGDIVPDEDGYYSYVSVIEEDEEYAELVYIWLTKDELTYSDEDAAVADLAEGDRPGWQDR